MSFVQLRRSHARTMFAANGTKIESKGEKKFKAITDVGFPLDCGFIFGAAKKILKSIAITCDERGEERTMGDPH